MDKNLKRLIVEALGTFILMFTIVMSLDPLAIGLVLAVLVYIFGHISGAHFNPAVTVAMMVNKKISIEEGAKYIAAQFAGAFLGILTSYIVLDQYFIPTISSENTFIEALIVEVVFTFALVLVIFNVAVNEKTKNNQYYGLAIGLILFVAASSGALVSGGAFNPAIGITPHILKFETIGQNWVSIVLYIMGPLLGAVGAALFNRYVIENYK